MAEIGDVCVMHVSDIGYFVRGKCAVIDRQQPRMPFPGANSIRTQHRPHTHTVEAVMHSRIRAPISLPWRPSWPAFDPRFQPSIAVSAFAAISRNGAQFIFNIYIVNFEITKWFSIFAAQPLLYHREHRTHTHTHMHTSAFHFISLCIRFIYASSDDLLTGKRDCGAHLAAMIWITISVHFAHISTKCTRSLPIIVLFFLPLPFAFCLAVLSRPLHRPSTPGPSAFASIDARRRKRFQKVHRGVVRFELSKAYMGRRL